MEKKRKDVVKLKAINKRINRYLAANNDDIKRENLEILKSAKPDLSKLTDRYF